MNTSRRALLSSPFVGGSVADLPRLGRHRSAAVSGGAGLPAGGVVTLNRLAFGPRPGELATFEALGGDDPARLEAWLDAQLDPTSFDESEMNARLAAAGFESYG